MSFHKLISWLKSIIRIFGYGFLLFSVPVGAITLAIAELLGIIEEIKEK